MPADLSLTTELSAVNSMLRSIGESPVNTLDAGLVDAILARDVLCEVSREVQSAGWHFNTDVDYKLMVQAFAPHYIYTPGTALEVDPSGVDHARDYVVRGDRLYDRVNHTYEFTGITSVLCNITWLLPFTDLPEVARRYINIRAGILFQDGQVSSELLHAFQARDEQKAWTALVRHESRTRDRNLLTGSRTIAHILNRRPN